MFYTGKIWCSYGVSTPDRWSLGLFLGRQGLLRTHRSLKTIVDGQITITLGARNYLYINHYITVIFGTFEILYYHSFSKHLHYCFCIIMTFLLFCSLNSLWTNRKLNSQYFVNDKRMVWLTLKYFFFYYSGVWCLTF